MYRKSKYLTAGDLSLVVEFGDDISPETSARVRGMFLAVERSEITGIVALNPTYRSLLIQYDPLIIPYKVLLQKLKSLEQNFTQIPLPSPNIFEVPTLYGGKYGPDLDFVCQNSGLSRQQVITLHTTPEYLIYMLGFAPGFPYLGGMDERIATPRLQDPRTKIPGGSVGIAGKQTGIYPIPSPGGWQLIGKTPIVLYDPLRNPPIFYQTGDYIKFVPIDEETYEHIAAEVVAGTYNYRIYAKEGRLADE